MTTLLWLRRDLRLDDHPALCAAASRGAVIPVFILDPETESRGAAPLWRLGEGLRVFAAALADRGSRLILRRGEALSALRDLARETGAEAVFWSRLYDPESRRRDEAVKAGLRAAGLDAESFPGHLLFEPWTVETGQGGPYRVYTPFMRALRQRDPGAARAAPKALARPSNWPESDRLEAWRLGAAMRAGAAVVGGFARIGEAAAQARLDGFLDGPVEEYAEQRNRLDRAATSRLSAHLALGEISPRRIWTTLMAREPGGLGRGAETFLREVIWRDFAWHLLFHYPDLATENWREGWDDFPWRPDTDDAERWRRGETGEDVIDAAMRELYVSGTMHNRARMVVASYLTKHLRTDWRVGRAWFEETLIDWDPASNAMGWQWVAGSGPDSAPFFRIFNPRKQAEQHDPEGAYRRFWLEGDGAAAFLRAAPGRWGLDAARARPAPLVDLGRARQVALDAYSTIQAR